MQRGQRAAADVARAYRYKPDPKYLAFILDQFNWVLGNNPFGICFVEGVGANPLPAYANPDARYPRGVPAGAVAFGIAAQGSVDAPSLEPEGPEVISARSAGCPMENSLVFLDALANLKRIRTAGAQKAQP